MAIDSSPLSIFTVMSVIEDENTQTWLLLRESGYYCEAESEKVIKKDMTDLEKQIVDDPGQIKEEIRIGIWEMEKKLKLRSTKNKKDHNRTNKRVPYCV